jgi:leader peptidase (prepilin peptidase)/N-methyltransferase
MLIGAIAALIAGLLINYLADVLPQTRRLSRPDWWPLTAKAIGGYWLSPRKFVVHGVYLLGFVYVWGNPPAGFPAPLLAAVLVYLGVVTVIDIEHRIVMHPVSAAGAILLGAVGAWRHGLAPTLVGGLVGFILMLGLYFLGDLLGRGLAAMRKEKWTETALGFGDVNLAGVIGLLMGWPGVLGALLLGIALAGVFSLVFVLASLLRGTYTHFAAIPYAPFLCAGAAVLVLLSVYAP